MDALVQDVLYAVRTLRKSRAFTLAAILTLALGIGANAGVFSVVNAVVLKPLQVPDASRLVRFVTVSSGSSSPLAFAQEFKVWRELTASFEDVSAHRLEFMTVTRGVEPEQIPVARVTANFFRVFRAPVQYGRAFTTEEDRPQGGEVAVLAFGFWARRFGRDPLIIGRTISLGGTPHVIVGILGPGLDTEQFDPAPDVWIPFQYEFDRKDGGDYSIVTGRLKPGVTGDSANAQLGLAFAEYRRTTPKAPTTQTAWVVQPLQDAMVGSVRSSLNLLLAAVGMVLLVACANVANLLLVRGDVRRRELAIRTALGAGRNRLLRQLLTETVVLSTAGGVLGLVVGTTAVRVLLALSPGNNPFTVENSGAIPRIGSGGSAFTLDWRVLAFTVVISMATGIVVGLLPAFQATRADPFVTLKSAAHTPGAGARRNRVRAILVVSELALAVMLVVGASLLIRTSLALRAVQPGFAADHVLTMRMSVAGTPFETSPGIGGLAREGVQRLRALPGVVDAGMTCCMPLETVWQLPFIVSGRPPSGLTRVGALSFHGFGGWTFVSPGYFSVFKIPLRRGRDFTTADTAGAPSVIIINEEMARRFWPAGDPLNDRLIIGRGMGP